MISCVPYSKLKTINLSHFRHLIVNLFELYSSFIVVIFRLHIGQWIILIIFDTFLLTKIAVQIENLSNRLKTLSFFLAIVIIAHFFYEFYANIGFYTKYFLIVRETRLWSIYNSLAIFSCDLFSRKNP